LAAVVTAVNISITKVERTVSTVWEFDF